MDPITFKNWMLKMGLKPIDVAYATHLSVPTVYNFLSGHRTTDRTKLDLDRYVKSIEATKKQKALAG